MVVRDEDKTIFLAGETSYTEALMLNRIADGVGPDVTQSMVTMDRINELVEKTPSVYLPSHDPESEKRLKERTAAMALQRVLCHEHWAHPRHRAFRAGNRSNPILYYDDSNRDPHENWPREAGFELCLALAWRLA